MGLSLRTGGSVWLLVARVLVVDVLIIASLASPRRGPVTYDLFYNGALGVTVLGLGLVVHADHLVFGGAIRAAHVGMDRMFDYGLKYPTAFADTHVGRIGRERGARPFGSSYSSAPQLCHHAHRAARHQRSEPVPRSRRAVGCSAIW